MKKLLSALAILGCLLPPVTFGGVGDPFWTYGEATVVNSSAATPNPDAAWRYGGNNLIHEDVTTTTLASDTLPIRNVIVTREPGSAADTGIS